MSSIMRDAVNEQKYSIVSDGVLEALSFQYCVANPSMAVTDGAIDTSVTAFMSFCVLSYSFAVPVLYDTELVI